MPYPLPKPSALELCVCTKRGTPGYLFGDPTQGPCPVCGGAGERPRLIAGSQFYGSPAYWNEEFYA